MAKFKNIKIKKKNGGFRLQRVQVLKTGKLKFVKNTSSRSAPRKLKSASRSVKKVARRKPRRKKQKPKTFLDRVGKPVSAMLYGAIRERTSDWLANTQIGKQFPVTQFTDEATMLLTMWGAKKMGLAKPGTLMARIVKNGEVIEYARLGETFSNMFMNKGPLKVAGAGSF